MIENMFRTINWKRLYTLALWSMAIGSGFLFCFWLWHCHYTGEVTLGSWGYPRIFDTIGLISWIFLNVLMLRVTAWFMSFSLDPPIGSIALNFSRRLFVALFWPLWLYASVADVMMSNDLLRLSVATIAAFVGVVSILFGHQLFHFWIKLGHWK